MIITDWTGKNMQHDIKEPATNGGGADYSRQFTQLQGQYTALVQQYNTLQGDITKLLEMFSAIQTTINDTYNLVGKSGNHNDELLDY